MKRIDKLMIIAGGGLFACIGIAEVFKREVSRRIKADVAYQEAVSLLKENKGARYLLGEPMVTDSLASSAGPGLSFTDHCAVKVPVSGPKSKGVLYFTTKPGEEYKLHLDTVQLQVGSDSTKRLVIKASKYSGNDEKGGAS